MSSMINCFWSLLSLRDLSFVYISPWLSKALGPDHDLLLGTSVFDYFHPQDRELARRDLSEFVKMKTITCSITRCRYNNVSAIKKRLQSQTSSNKGFSPSKLTYQDDDSDYIIMHLGMNVVSHDIVLACFHPDDAKPSSCLQNSCGEIEFTKDELNKLSSLLREHSTIGFSKVQTPPATPFPENKSFSGDRIDVQSPNCLKLISNKHTIMSPSGDSQQVESVMIPYGIIIFACFQILPSTSSTVSSFGSPPFKPQKSLSAPCSPPTINGNTKRPRSPNSSPGSLSPSDLANNKSYNNSSVHSYPYRQEFSEFLDSRSSKRVRPNNISPIPHPLMNPVSPHNSPVYQNQYPFPSMSQSQNDQKLPTMSHQQIYFTQHNQQQQQQQQHNQQYNQQLSQQLSQHPQHPHIVNSYPSPTILPQQDNNNIIHQRPNPPPPNPPPTSQPQSIPNQTASFTQFTPSSQRRSNTTINGTKKCESCHTSSSPEWRRGPTGHKTLCNACGLRYSRTIAREIRKREQAQREQEQRIREQREGEERARERAATIMMQHVIEPHYQYRPNTNITNVVPSYQLPHHHHNHQSSTYHPTLPPLSSQPQSHLPPMGFPLGLRPKSFF
ncbi:gata transcription [Gigaspora margarita]|uniref:Gata transcription n=1 Tax=Gigaspora margarita TaxID=4874 RepID=A0A8H3XKD3_GIGMA|nr:gata transcription [Gigaspora margarita]